LAILVQKKLYVCSTDSIKTLRIRIRMNVLLFSNICALTSRRTTTSCAPASRGRGTTPPPGSSSTTAPRTSSTAATAPLASPSSREGEHCGGLLLLVCWLPRRGEIHTVCNPLTKKAVRIPSHQQLQPRLLTHSLTSMSSPRQRHTTEWWRCGTS
jgi:hypothetical protein